MSKFKTYEESKFEEAIQASEDAKLRRKFQTKTKLLLNPSDEMCKKHPANTIYTTHGCDVALMYPDGRLEDQYGYTDGIPDEHKEWYTSQEAKELKKEIGDWVELRKATSPIEDDYNLLMEFLKFNNLLWRVPAYEGAVNDFLSSTDWLVFRGYVTKEK